MVCYPGACPAQDGHFSSERRSLTVSFRQVEVEGSVEFPSGCNGGEPVIDGKKGQLEAVGDAQLVKNIADVMLHGLLAD